MGAPSWHELVTLMVHGSDLPMRGRIRHVDGSGDAGRVWFARGGGGPMPAVPAAQGDAIDVWRHGGRLRLAEPGGDLVLVSDGTTAWHFAQPGEPPLESPAEHVTLLRSGTELLTRTSAERWLGDDFTRPTGPVEEATFLGRPAYALELAPPSRKPHPLQLVVDAESGLLLQQRNDGVGIVSEWTELVVGEDLDPDLFTWDGAAVSWEDQQVEVQRQREAEDRERGQWTLEEFGSRTVEVEVEAEVVIRHRAPDGTLHASLDPIGSLSRRPRSDTRWDEVEDRNTDTTHRWTDTRWDWALQAWGAPVTEASLEALKARLAPGVTGK